MSSKITMNPKLGVRFRSTKKQIKKIVDQQIIPKQFKKSDVCDLIEILIDKKSSALSGQILNVGGV